MSIPDPLEFARKAGERADAAEARADVAEKRAAAAEIRAKLEQDAQQANQMELYRLASAKATLDQTVKGLTTEKAQLLETVGHRDTSLLVAEEERARAQKGRNRFALLYEGEQKKVREARNAMRPLRIATAIIIAVALLIGTGSLIAMHYAVKDCIQPGEQHGLDSTE